MTTNEKPFPIHPQHDNVIVERAEVKDKTKGGIHLPDSTITDARMRTNEGRVLAKGRGRYSSDGALIPMSEAQVGDFVVFRAYAASEITHDGETYLNVSDNDIVCVVDSPKQATKTTTPKLDAGLETVPTVGAEVPV